jgi:hypothetical protein
VKGVVEGAVRRRPDVARCKAGKARRSAAYWMYVSIRGPQPNAADGRGLAPPNKEGEGPAMNGILKRAKTLK